VIWQSGYEWKRISVGNIYDAVLVTHWRQKSASKCLIKLLALFRQVSSASVLHFGHEVQINGRFLQHANIYLHIYILSFLWYWVLNLPSQMFFFFSKKKWFRKLCHLNKKWKMLLSLKFHCEHYDLLLCFSWNEFFWNVHYLIH